MIERKEKLQDADEKFQSSLYLTAGCPKKCGTSLEKIDSASSKVR